jgi:superfamily II DNA or RNA helicase
LTNFCTLVVENIWSYLKSSNDLDSKVIRRLESEMSYTVQEYNRFTKKTLEHNYPLFERNLMRYPTGLYSVFDRILTEANIEFDVIDKRIKPVKQQSINLIPWQTKYSKELRDYQKKVVDDAIKAERGIIKVATGGGKTVIAGAIIAELNLKTIFVVNSVDLLEQSADLFEEMFQQKVGRIGGGFCDIEKINICTIQTLYNAFDLKFDYDPELHIKEKIDKKILEKKAEIRQVVENTDVIINDECFHGATRINIDLNRRVDIKTVCNNKFITHVLSYNHEKQIFEQKRILHKFITPVCDYWQVVEVKIGDKIKKIRCTPTHKFWTKNRGYVEAKDLTSNDILKINGNEIKNASCCTVCGKFGEPRRRCPKHLRVPMSEEKRKKISQYPKVIEYRKKKSQQMKENNTANDPEIRKKVTESWKLNWENKSEEEKAKVRENYINAPKRGNGKVWAPTSLEQKIIDLQIPEIAYTGNGKMWLCIGKKENGKNWSKNPDFKIRNQRKVIEVGNVTYWHTEEEIEKTVKAYESKNFKCLYLTNFDVEDNWEETVEKIKTFVFNHDEAIVISSKIGLKNKREGNFKYNIEVEDNHNYFAEGILVSNCQHSSSGTYVETMTLAKNAYIRFGFSATPYRDTSVDNILTAYSGKLICNITASELIRQGFLIRPKIYMIESAGDENYKFVKKTYNKVYEDHIINNENRNELIRDCAIRLIERSKTVLITVTRIIHGETIYKLLEDAGITSLAFIRGECSKETRKDLLNKVRQKQLKIIIGTSLADEGLDLPALDAVILAGGGKSLIKALQRVGRALRKYPGKTEAVVIDFYDKVRYLSGHSKKRIRIYESEPEFQIFKEFNLK